MIWDSADRQAAADAPASRTASSTRPSIQPVASSSLAPARAGEGSPSDARHRGSRLGYRIRIAPLHGVARKGVSEVVFSADGRWLVTTSDDDTAQLWDVASGQRRSTWRRRRRAPRRVQPRWHARRHPAGRSAHVWSVDSDRPVAALEEASRRTRRRSARMERFSSSEAGWRESVGPRDVDARQKLRFPGTASSVLSLQLGRRLSAHRVGRWRGPSGPSNGRAESSRSRSFTPHVFARFSPDDSMVITAAGHHRRAYGRPPDESSVRYWDVRSGERRSSTR